MEDTNLVFYYTILKSDFIMSKKKLLLDIQWVMCVPITVKKVRRYFFLL